MKIAGLSSIFGPRWNVVYRDKVQKEVVEKFVKDKSQEVVQIITEKEDVYGALTSLLLGFGDNSAAMAKSLFKEISKLPDDGKKFFATVNNFLKKTEDKKDFSRRYFAQVMQDMQMDYKIGNKGPNKAVLEHYADELCIMAKNNGLEPELLVKE